MSSPSDLPRTQDDSSGSPRVLVVDDDPDIRALIRWVLRRAGWTVHLAASGSQALDLAGGHPLDLIVLDAWLGGARGDPAALVRALRQLPGGAGLPMVFVTARVGPQDLALYSRLGIPVIPKPFEVANLEPQLRPLLRRQGPSGGKNIP